MLSPTWSARRGQPDVVSPTWSARRGQPDGGSDGRPCRACRRRPFARPSRRPRLGSLPVARPSRRPPLGSLPACSPPRRGVRRAHRRPPAAPVGRARRPRTPPRPRRSTSSLGRDWAHCPCVHYPGAGSDGQTVGRARRPQTQTAPADADRARRQRTSASVEAGGELTEQVLLALIEFVIGAGNIACC